MCRGWIQLLLICGLWVTCGAGAPPTVSLAPPSVTAGQAWSPEAPAGRWMLRCQISGVSECKLDRSPNRARRFDLQSTCYRDGERLDVETTRWDEGKPVRAWRSIVNRWYVSYEVPPVGEQSPLGFYAADGSAFAGAAIPSAWGAFDGYIADDYIRFTDVLKTASRVQTSQETVDGFSCLVIKAQSPDYGSYQVWLDMAADRLPRKVVVEKTAANYWGKIRLKQWTYLAPRGSHGTVPLQRVTFTMGQVKLDQVQGRWFPLGCQVTRENHYADGNVQRTEMTCHRNGLDLDPDFAAAKAFVPQLRQGARLANQIEPQLAFQWKNQSPVPLVDSGLVAGMDQTATTLQQEMNRSQKAGAK